jgi:hypothetical protein
MTMDTAPGLVRGACGHASSVELTHLQNNTLVSARTSSHTAEGEKKSQQSYTSKIDVND